MRLGKSKYFVLLLTVVFSKTDASNGPANHAVLLGSNASLTCADGAPGKWTFYRDGSSGKQIANSRSSYVINQTKLEDAGLYGCFSSNGERRAQLIILASDPLCSLRINDDQISRDSIALRKRDVLIVSCEVRYWGDWPPTMDCRDETGHLQKGEVFKTNTSSHGNIVKSSIAFEFLDATLFPHPTELQFSCRTNFTGKEQSADHPESAINQATNIPGYSHTWSSPKILIRGTEEPTEEPQLLILNGISKQTMTLVAACVGVFIFGLITGVLLILKCKAKNSKDDKTKYRQVEAREKQAYCEINELEMDPQEDPAPRKLRGDSTKMEKTGMKTREQPTTVETEGGMCDVGVEGVPYVNKTAGRETYENGEPTGNGLEMEGEDDSSGIESIVSNDPHVNKSYVPIDPSKRAVPLPSVYNRLRNNERTPGSSNLDLSSNVVPSRVDEQSCSSTGRRPKLPTPESRSLSDSPKYLRII